MANLEEFIRSEEKKYLKDLLDRALKACTDHNETTKRLAIHIQQLWNEIDLLKMKESHDLKDELDQTKDKLNFLETKLSDCEAEMKKRGEVDDAQFQKDIANTFKLERTDN